MEQIKINDWIFCIDIEKTRNYYARQLALPEILFLDKYPDSMKAFLAQCGVDFEKPCAAASESDNMYYLYGTAHSDEGYELDFYGENQFASIVVYFDQPFSDGPSFSMEIFC